MPLWNLKDDYPPQMYVQFPDLTEIHYHYALTSCSKKTLEESVKTEFVFTLQSPVHSRGGHGAVLHDFKCVSSMRNWSKFHPDWDKRRLDLWWKRIHPEAEPQESARYRWRTLESDPTQRHQASGCGFRIAEPPLETRMFTKFFSLLRMPLEPRPIQLRWLANNNYRLIERGNLASYWVNGWNPLDYTMENEIEYWRKVEEKRREARSKRASKKSTPVIIPPPIILPEPAPNYAGQVAGF